ncbi:MAG TPA: PIN domain nuclease [Candidatus Avidehalobacter gallistercoris]|uniref:PIN domain nuclease n=1 Tax=Candidatus Avidehalobacter gallistercoris TaxID=2840694 RepID=A0A9D1KZW2_9FIRM|nr:PIN domain nuclease [Candidatus Avidehalobacter gallistercoris]
MDNKPYAPAPEENSSAAQSIPTWRKVLKTGFTVLLYLAVGIGVFWLAYQFSDAMDIVERCIAVVSATIIGVMVSMMLLSPIISWVATLLGHLLNQLFKMPLQDIVSAVFGLIVGLIIASLLNSVVGKLPVIGPYFTMLSLLVFAYMGLVLGYRKRSEFIALFNWRPVRARAGHTAPLPDVKLLDTSVIIDGRIADICRSGFLEGQLAVPVFVLNELRHIADLSDVLKRNRGRRGLDILNRMQKELPGGVMTIETDYPDMLEVDNKLLRLAQDMKATVITNDYNLGKVAQVQGVRILNVNELAGALRAVWLPGETVNVDIVQAGKEPNQGLAFLDDGTMIVVENGRSYIGQQVAAEVSSVLQTSAGRMIFAKLADKPF